MRIQRRVSKKRYLNGKRVYEYERLSLDIPKKYHRLVAGLFDQDFDIDVQVEKGIVTVTLAPRKAS